MRLTIELLSDLCAGTGEATGGAVDAAVAEDEYGIPVIPGKRIKGLFREAAEELMDHGLALSADVDAVFGVPGGAQSRIHFGTLYPAGYQKMCSLLEAMKKDGAWASYAERSQVRSFYTTVRTQTAIGAAGVADRNTLRSSRVVCRKCKGDGAGGNRIFEGEIEIPEAMEKQYEELLERCAKMVRHIGLNRTRGYGNVVCRVELQKRNDGTAAFAGLSDGETCRTDSASEEDTVLGVHLILEQPCVLEESFISGRALMGSFAAAFLGRAREAGEDIQNIHENEMFRALFLSGEVQYGFCWPYENKRVHEPLPKSFLQEKYGDDRENTLYDLASCRQDAVFDFMDAKEKAGERFVALQGETLYCSNVERDMRNHHRRPEDRAVGHATGKEGKGDRSTGQLYAFDLIKAGQEFYGEIRGRKSLLEALQKLAENGSRLYFGAARTAEYGAVRVYYGQKEEENCYVKPAKKTVITLRSPMVAEDCFGNDSTAVLDVFRAIFPEKNLSDLSAQSVSFFEEGIRGGYHAKWGMPLPQRTVLVPGSEVVIYGLELSKEEITELEKKSYGRYTQEGYGRIAVNRHGKKKEVSVQEEPKITMARWPEAEEWHGSEKTESLRFLEVCLRDRLYQTCEKTECIEKIKRHLEKVPNQSVLSGIIQVTRTSGNFEEWKQQLRQASDRVSEKNAKWCEELGKMTFGSKQEELIFIQDGIQKMQGDTALQDIPPSWKADERWRAMLDGDAGFRIFQDILTRKLCEVQLKKGRREE